VKQSVKTLIFIFLFLLVLAASTKSLAWGGRGHATICEAATYLVKNPDLKKFMTHRPHIMGHLCNIADIYWKSLPGDMQKDGNPAHFIDSDILPLKIKDIPLDYSQLIQDYQGKAKANDANSIIRSFPHDFGSAWWRTNQFYNLAITGKADMILPLDKKEEQNDNHGYNKGVYNFFVNLGLMGHFAGDSSQPFHNTDDYDGYKKGHGGIHAYYEEVVLASLDGDLHHKILMAARKIQNAPRLESFLTAPTVLEKVKALSVMTYADLDAVLKADLLKKPSEQKEERGMKLRTPAEREPIEKTIKKFEPLIVKHMARGAVLIAQLWDDAYKAAENPNLSYYRSYKYPFTPDFVFPDYYEIKKEQKPEAKKE
jgi:hypothetical protein